MGLLDFYKGGGKLTPAVAVVDQLPSRERAIAAEREKFVRLVMDASNQPGITIPDACTLVALNHRLEFPLLSSSGHGGKGQLTYNNYRNWSATLRSRGSLLRNYARGERPARGNARFWEYFWSFYLNCNRLPLTEAYRLAVRKFTQESNDPVPSMAQARYCAGKVDPAAVIYARYGETAARNKFVDFIRRDWSDLQPGDCVIGDSRTFDTRVRVWDDAKKRWIAVRPTIAALLDARSWYLASYWITTEPVCADTLIDTLALYLVNTAGQPPAYAYFDNGKDYTAAGFSSPFVAGEFEHSIFAELGITSVTALPYNGRAKTVESFFKNMMLRFDKIFPDYLGSRPGQRTPGADYYDRHPEELPSLEQFCEIFATWLADEHQRPKNGDLHGGKSPAEIWNSRPARKSFTIDELRFAMLRPQGLRKVDRGPSVRWNNRSYFCDQLRFDSEVMIKTDRMDSEHIYCFTLDGILIGEARTRARIKALALDDEAARRAIGEQLARQRRQLTEARTTVEKLSGGKYLASPVEILAADPDAVITASRDTSSSVKGMTHSVRHIGMEGVSFRDDDSQSADPVTDESVPEETLEDPAALASFDHFMRSREREQY